MSLTKALKLPKSKLEIIDIAPKTITKNELQVQVNDIDAEIVSINKVDEYARGTTMYGYLIQVLKPTQQVSRTNNPKTVKGYDKISITLHSNETNEKGKGEYFIKRIGN